MISLDERLQQFNPWWTRPDWAASDLHLEAIASRVVRWDPPAYLALQPVPGRIDTLRGARQVGKSTTVKRLIARLLQRHPRANVLYFDFELDATAATIGAVLGRARAMRGGAWFCFLDGALELPGWEQALQAALGTTLDADDYLLLTGATWGGRRGADVARRRRGRDLVQMPIPFSVFCREVERERRLPPPVPLAELLTPAGRAQLAALLPRRPALQRALHVYSRVGGFPDAASLYTLSRSTRNTWDQLFTLHWSGIRRDVELAGVSAAACAQAITQLDGAPTPAGTGPADEDGPPPPASTGGETIRRGRDAGPAAAAFQALARCFLAFSLIVAPDVTDLADDDTPSGETVVSVAAASDRPSRRETPCYLADPMVAQIPPRATAAGAAPGGRHVLRSQLAVAMVRLSGASPFGGSPPGANPSGRLRAVPDAPVPDTWLLRERMPDGGVAREIVVAYAGDDANGHTALRAWLRALGRAGLVVSNTAAELEEEVPVVPASLLLAMLRAGEVEET